MPQIDPTALTYWIVLDSTNKLVTYGVVDKGLQVATGQPTLNSYADQASFLAALSALGVNVSDAQFLSDLASQEAWAERVALTN